MNKNINITSPKGTAMWPKLNEPDFKFKELGEFSVNLLLTPEAAAPFIARLEQIHLSGYTEQCKLLRKTNLKQFDRPWKDDTDKEGTPTGNIRFSFKANAAFRSKDTNEVIKRSVPLFDSKGQPMKDTVGGGSVIRVNCEPRPWYVPALGYGLSLSLVAVQVLELKAGSAALRDAKALGFTAEEEGYVSGGESLPNEAFGKAEPVAVGAEPTDF